MAKQAASKRYVIPILTVTGVLMLSACAEGVGLSEFGRLIDPVPVYKPVEERREPDARGVIAYPNYQVIVAGSNDSIAAMAGRVGLTPDQLAEYNGLPVNYRVSAGEVLALPDSVPRSGSASGQSIEEIASSAIDRAPGTAPAEPGNDPAEPIRHIVEPGETAYSIARLYDVSVTALASWNGLGRDLTVRVGQQLLIPMSAGGPSAAAAVSAPTVSAPGTGSATPTPPSASKPLPAPVEVAELPESPNLAEDRSPAGSSGKMLMPVNGEIIRGYSKGRNGNDGIDIAADAGTPVRAAATGEVALVSHSKENDTTILLLRHPDDLYTVYIDITGVSLTKGQTVSRGQTIGKVAKGNPSRMQFQIRRGEGSVDPAPYL